jgi:MFS family permease
VTESVLRPLANAAPLARPREATTLARMVIPPFLRGRHGLRPTTDISPDQLSQAQRTLVRDLAWASLCGSFSSGVILTAFALSLGASPLLIGVLAAIPFFCQAAQLPAAVLVERVRLRQRIGVIAITTARVLILSMAVLPWLPRTQALYVLVGLQFLVSLLNAVGSCAINSWLHQLVPHEQLGDFFARRLVAGTAASCAGTLAAGVLVDHFESATIPAYALLFALAAVTGLVSSHYLASTPEPLMRDAGPPARWRDLLVRPFRDRRYRHLLVFLGAWTATSSLAAPFIAVYLVEQRHYAVGLVTTLWVTSQVANAITLYAWGRLSDQFSNKAVLAVALPVYFGCMLLLTLLDSLSSPEAQLALLYLIHIVLGVATGGIGLATGNLGLKLAPHGQGTPYLAAIGLVAAVAGGIAPIVAGALASFFEARQLSGVIRWFAPGGSRETTLFEFTHWGFVFGLSALLGLYVMHALSRVDEGDEHSERDVVQAFALETLRTVNSLSSVAGSLGSLFPFERATERRRWWRPAQRFAARRDAGAHAR